MVYIVTSSYSNIKTITEKTINYSIDRAFIMFKIIENYLDSITVLYFYIHTRKIISKFK